MRVVLLLLTTIALLLISCFPFAENWEEEINSYFFLYKAENKKVYLGTTDLGYKIGNMYLGPVSKVGWNDDILIVKDELDRYYVQRINFDGLNAKQLTPKEFASSRYGPYSLKEFEVKRGKLKVPSTLSFKHQF